jgi:outer membrane protein assembly factor BamB
VPGLSRPPLRVWVWTAAALAVAVVVALLWRGSDAAATTSTTAAPAAPLTGSPAAAVSPAWSAAGGALPGHLVVHGRVLVGSAHGLQALDVRTGRAAWTYQRTNARLCGVAAADGNAVAVFDVPHETSRCDQVVALDVDTGVRAWTRNANFSPDVALVGVDRTPQAAGSVVAWNPTGLVDLDPAGDNIRWRYHTPAGCRISEVTPGSSGIAVVQRCTGAPPQLRLVDAIGGGVRWTKALAAGAAPQVAGADGAVTVADGTTLDVLSADDGTPRAALPLPAGAADAAEVAAGGVVVVSAGSAVTGVDPRTGAQVWQVPAVGSAGPVDPDDADVVVPEDGALVVRDAATGGERSRSAVTGLPPGGTAAAAGPVVVYRTSGRVAGYR